VHFRIFPPKFLLVLSRELNDTGNYLLYPIFGLKDTPLDSFVGDPPPTSSIAFPTCIDFKFRIYFILFKFLDLKTNLIFDKH